MKKLFITGLGQFGKQVIDALQYTNQLNCDVKCFINTSIDEGIVKNMEKGTVWIIISSWMDLQTSRNNQSTIIPASEKVILVAVPSSDISQKEIMQVYNRLLPIETHMLIPFAAQRALVTIEETVSLFTELFAAKWTNGIIRIDLNDVQELLLDSKELYFGETGNTDDVSDYFQAICLACVRAFPSKKIAGQVHVFVLLEGAQLDLELFNQGIEQLGDYCDDYFVTLGICESNLKEYHAVIFAGVEK
jgi:hypothetical protein